MTIRTKTTIWAFPTDTADVLDATDRIFATQTIYVPETSSRTFRSAILELYWQDFVTLTGGTVTATQVGISVGGASVSYTTETDDLTHSGENIGAIFHIDVTSHVTTNFGAGASQTFAVRLNIDQSTGTTLGTRNCSCKLYLTYDYDDSVATHCKTVVLPLESPTGAIGFGSLTEIGTNQVPILTGASGILKETNIVIRDYFFEIEGNQNGNASTTNMTTQFALDADAATNMGVENRTFGSEIFFRYLWSKKGSVPTTTAAHAFKANCAAVLSHHHMAVKLYVTYEFDGNSAAATNSVALPFSVPVNGSTTSADQFVVRVPIDIQEPDTIALIQSGVELHWSISGAMTTSSYVSVGVGSQAARAYTSNLASASECGDMVLIQRFDAGSAQGAGATLTRGQCYVDVKVFAGAQRTIAGMTGIVWLNYTSGVAAGTNGIAKHNRTIYSQMAQIEYFLQTQTSETAAVAPVAIAETDYKVQCVGLCVIQQINGTTGTPWLEMFAEVKANEGVLGVADGWEKVLSYCPAVNTEVGSYFVYADMSRLFIRHSSDPKAYLMNPETTRKWRIISPRGPFGGIKALTTIHSITYTKTGAVTGYAGTGAVTVNAHDDTSGELLYTVTASAGGSYTVTTFDNTRYHYSEVFEDATHVGRSPKWMAA